MTTKPTLDVPARAVDTHMHFYGPYERYPLSPTTPNTPEPALLDDYRTLQERLGLERVVVVQPAGYGFDNRCTMENVEALGAEARAVVVVEPGSDMAALEDLAARGARGLRVFLLPGGVYDFDQVEDLAAMVEPVGWHLQMQFDGRLLPERIDRLLKLKAQLVFDHTGKFLEPVEPEHEAFDCLRRLVDAGAYVKLSAPYETSKSGPPAYEDVGRLARILVEQAPERMLWATNWPHPRHWPKDEAMLLDTLLHWAPDDATRTKILVDNPARLYGFE